MAGIRTQKGDGNLGCILWVAILLLGIFVAWKAIPVKVQSAELYDFMVQQAEFAGSNTADKIEERILARAHELDLPLEKKNLKVERMRDRIRIKATYVVPLEFPGYTYHWSFDHEIDRPIYIM